MGSDDHLQIQQLFLQLVDVPGTEWEARLENCSDDPAIRGRVLMLLRADARAMNSKWLETNLNRAAPARTQEHLDGDGPLASGAEFPRIVGYEILREIGEGGMGVVYEARERELNRPVALKILRLPAHGADKNLTRFRLEMDALARLEHPNIVRIYRGSESGGQPFCAMELLRGGNLAQQQRNQPMRPREAARLIETLALTVDFAHQRGILHRDIKPANVLFAPDGSPKLGDFGLAKLIQDDSSLTQSGELLGTPSYMAPEQVANPPEPATISADVYGLGATLYELLTGQPPFRGPTPWAILEHVRCDEPIPPRNLNPEVSRDLENICLKCLRKAPAQRYATAGGLAEDLRRFQAGEPISARPVTSLGRLWRLARRRPLHAVSALLLVVLSLVVTVLGVVTHLWRSASQARQETILAQRQLEALTYAHRLALADTRRQEGQFGSMLELLQQCPEEFRQWEWRYLAEQCRLRAVLRGHADTVTCAAVSPDGKWIASAGFDGSVRLWRWGQARPERELRGHNLPVRCVAFSPDGKFIASGGDDCVVRLWNMEDGTELRRFTQHEGAIHEVAFSPDGQLLASGGADETTRAWNVAVGKQVFLSEKHGANVYALAFNPTDGSLVVGGAFLDIVVWDLANGQRKATWSGATGSIDSLCFDSHPDRSHDRLYSADRSYELRCWDPVDGKRLNAIQGHDQDINCVCLTRGSDWLASVSDDSSLRVRDSSTLDLLLEMRGHRGHINWVVSHPTEDVLVTASDDHEVGVWYIGDTSPTLFQANAATVRDVSFGAGGMLASAHEDGTIRVRHPKAGGVVEVDGRVGSVKSVCFSPRGDRLALAGEECIVRIIEVGSWRQLRQHSWPKAAPTSSERREPTRRTNDIVREMRELGPITSFLPVRFTADGRELVCGGNDARIRVYSVDQEAERTIHSGHIGPISCLEFNPAGTTLATCGLDRRIVLYDWPSGKVRNLLEKHGDYVYGIAFNPDGSRLASVSADFTVVIWDVASGSVENKLTGHADNITGVAFSRDGDRIATSSWDGTVRIWDADRGRELLALKTRTKKPHAVRFSPCGAYLACCGDGGYVEVFEAPGRARGW